MSNSCAPQAPRHSLLFDWLPKEVTLGSGMSSLRSRFQTFIQKAEYSVENKSAFASTEKKRVLTAALSSEHSQKRRFFRKTFDVVFYWHFLEVVNDRD